MSFEWDAWHKWFNVQWTICTCLFTIVWFAVLSLLLLFIEIPVLCCIWSDSSPVALVIVWDARHKKQDTWGQQSVYGPNLIWSLAFLSSYNFAFLYYLTAIRSDNLFFPHVKCFISWKGIRYHKNCKKLFAPYTTDAAHTAFRGIWDSNTEISANCTGSLDACNQSMNNFTHVGTTFSPFTPAERSCSLDLVYIKNRFIFRLYNTWTWQRYIHCI